MNRREAEELLPWFVAGTLSEPESRAVQAFIDNGEISNSELDELAMFADTVAEKGADEPAYDPAILTRVMAGLDDTPQEQPDEPLIVREARARAPGLIQRLLDRIQWSMTPALAKVAIVGQFALVLGLAVAISNTTGERSPQEVVSGTVSATGSAADVDISIGFAPDVTEADLRGLLRQHGASIVAGPSALGLYDIDVAEDAQVALVLAALKASPLITFAEAQAQPQP